MIMGREKLFEEFLNECKKNNQICGAGNPYAQILLVGQEHRAKERINSVEAWKEYLRNNYRYCEKDNPWIITDENSDLWRKYQNSTPTWSCYQRLIEKALGERKKRVLQGDKDFEFDAFTTELNNEAKPSSRVKGKNEREKLRERIEARLKVFKHSDYIKSFPVIVLACGGYIRNNDKVREIDDTFHVTFSKRYDYSTGNWFCTHYDDTNPKRLVIHTRQLSNGVSYEMIDKMASVIRDHLDHLKKLGLI
jgi:hypothetical protein